MNQLHVSQQILSPDCIDLYIKGELDANTAIDMDKVVQQAYAHKQVKILVDCTELRYISSAGLGVFISYLDDLRNDGGFFVFYHMQPGVYSVFELLGLHKLLAIVSDRSAALQYKP